MNHEQFATLADNRLNHCRQVMVEKAKEYSRNGDRLHNFKRAADMDGTTPTRSLWGMWKKHLVSIADMIDDLDDGKVPSESMVAEKLGETAAAGAHIHFSRIEFTKAGEKRHWTFADPYGPPHEPLLELIAARGYAPRIICESAGTQAADALTMRDYYRSLLSG